MVAVVVVAAARDATSFEDTMVEPVVFGYSSRTAFRHSQEMSVGVRFRIQLMYSSTLSASRASRARSAMKRAAQTGYDRGRQPLMGGGRSDYLLSQ